MKPQEQAYVDKIALLWPDGYVCEASPAVLALIEEAVSIFPDCAKLWCLRGDLICLSSLEANYELVDALFSYEQALKADPELSEAYQEIGYYYDVYFEDLNLSEIAFRKAIAFGAGSDSYFGLARVLAEQNRRQEALQILDPQSCPFQNEIEIQIIRDEIVSGVWSRSEDDSEEDYCLSR